MPTYEYACSKCGRQFERVQSIKDKALTVCPKDACPRKPWGKGKVKRQIVAGGGLIFKGSGFYITDYRSEGYKSAAKKDAEAQSPGKTDTKAAGTKESKPAASGGSTAAPAAPTAPAKKKAAD